MQILSTYRKYSGGNPLLTSLVRYFAALGTGRLVLWAYFIWYLVIVARYFDPAPRIWLTSIGLSALVGTGLYISTAACGANSVQLKFWQVVRLYLTPFCVSSFSALVKEHNFILVVSPQPIDSIVALAIIAVFLSLAWAARKATKSNGPVILPVGDPAPED